MDDPNIDNKSSYCITPKLHLRPVTRSMTRDFDESIHFQAAENSESSSQAVAENESTLDALYKTALEGITDSSMCDLDDLIREDDEEEDITPVSHYAKNSKNLVPGKSQNSIDPEENKENQTPNFKPKTQSVSSPKDYLHSSNETYIVTKAPETKPNSTHCATPEITLQDPETPILEVTATRPEDPVALVSQVEDMGRKMKILESNLKDNKDLYQTALKQNSEYKLEIENLQQTIENFKMVLDSKKRENKKLCHENEMLKFDAKKVKGILGIFELSLSRCKTWKIVQKKASKFPPFPSQEIIELTNEKNLLKNEIKKLEFQNENLKKSEAAAIEKYQQLQEENFQLSNHGPALSPEQIEYMKKSVQFNKLDLTPELIDSRMPAGTPVRKGRQPKMTVTPARSLLKKATTESSMKLTANPDGTLEKPRPKAKTASISSLAAGDANLNKMSVGDSLYYECEQASIAIQQLKEKFSKRTEISSPESTSLCAVNSQQGIFSPEEELQLKINCMDASRMQFNETVNSINLLDDIGLGKMISRLFF